VHHHEHFLREILDIRTPGAEVLERTPDEVAVLRIDRRHVERGRCRHGLDQGRPHEIHIIMNAAPSRKLQKNAQAAPKPAVPPTAGCRQMSTGIGALSIDSSCRTNGTTPLAPMVMKSPSITGACT